MIWGQQLGYAFDHGCSRNTDLQISSTRQSWG